MLVLNCFNNIHKGQQHLPQTLSNGLCTFFECFSDALLLNLFAFSIAKLNKGICIPRLRMSLLSPPEYNVSMVTRRNKHEICRGFVKCLYTRPPCVPWGLAGRTVWLQVSVQKINKSNICIGKLMRLALCWSHRQAHFVTLPSTLQTWNTRQCWDRIEMGRLE